MLLNLGQMSKVIYIDLQFKGIDLFMNKLQHQDISIILLLLYINFVVLSLVDLIVINLRLLSVVQIILKH